MKSKVFFLAALALVFGARAEPVDVEKAKLAVRAWVCRGGTLGAALGQTVESAATHVTTNGVKFYSVKMKGGGTVFTTADTEDGVVVGFTSGDADYSSLDPSAPLSALLNRDIALRSANRPVRAVAAAGSAASAASPSARLWAALVAEGEILSDPNVKLPLRTHVSLPGDVRVAPLVKSTWDQSTVAGEDCYNRFTPELSDGARAVCGCVATAMSQVMRYHRYPTNSVAQVTRQCTIEAGALGNPAANTNMTTQGGFYDWDGMPLTPGYSITAEQCEAIGKITSDAGICVCMNYDLTKAGGSGSFMFNVVPALLDVFGYASADYFSSDEITDNPSNVRKMMLSNLDAGYPVLMGIRGDGGHAIVGDGYGYNNETLYVHLNMGWSGSYNFWYNLPGIDAGYNSFNVFESLVFNIFPDAKGATLSGMAVDENGSRLDQVTVTAYRAGTKEKVASAVAKKGVFGLKLPASTYDLVAVSSDEMMSCELKSVAVSGTSSAKKSMSGVITGNPLWVKTYYNIPYVTGVGNRWGVEMTLLETAFEGSVSNVTRGASYGTLDAALAETAAGDVLEILAPTIMRFPQAVSHDVTIRTASGVAPSSAFVTCRPGAAFTNVTAVLALENVSFADTSGCFVNVSAGGGVSVKGLVELTDGDSGGTYIATADENGVILAGALESYLTVQCAAAAAINQKFGSAVCDLDTARACAARFLNPFDADLGGAVDDDGSLFWDRVPVAPEIAVAFFTADSGGTVQYYRNLATIFADHPNEDGDVVVLKNCSLASAASVVGATVRFFSTNAAAPVITYAADAVFRVDGGSSLTVSNLVFYGASGEGAFVVKGGELVLDAGVLVADCANTVVTDESLGVYAFAGGVSVLCDEEDGYRPGRAVMRPGASITGCSTSYGNGGGVFVEFGGCEFDMQGGVVSNCFSEGFGGGVYVDSWPGMDVSTVRISGDARICCSSSNAGEGGAAVDDNLFLTSDDELVLAGGLTGGVHLRCTGLENAATGVQFGLVDDGCDDLAASNSAVFFLCDDAPGVWHGAFAADGGVRRLVWSDEFVPSPVPPPEYVVARVLYDNGDGTVETNEFSSFNAALASISADAVVEVNAHAFPTETEIVYPPLTEEEIVATTNLIPYLSSSVEIKHAVVIRTEPGDWTNIICRTGDAVITVSDGGSVTLDKIIFAGGYPMLYVDFDDMSLQCGGFQPGGATAMFRVGEGGELTLGDGSGIRDVKGSASRDACAVSVYNGTLTMLSGSFIRDCVNKWSDVQNIAESPAGGVVVSGPSAAFLFQGGEITGCSGYTGGGVLVENGANFDVSGDGSVKDNAFYGSSPEITANLSVANEATDGEGEVFISGNVRLVGEFTGSIGVLEPRIYEEEAENINTNVFGVVPPGLSLRQLVPSAANFHRDVDASVTGRIVTTNSTEGLLVWSTAVKDGVYTDENGVEFREVTESGDTPVSPPVPVAGLVYNAAVQTGVVAAAGYTVANAAAVNAGVYTAVVTLEPGYVWSDDSYEPLEIQWAIDKAVYDMSGVSFADAEFVYDGSPKSVFIVGEPPEGVVTNYENNVQTEVGVYTATVHFTGDAQNYYPINDMTATLTIVENPDPPEPPEPPEPVVTNHPTPFAFSSIERLSALEWRLTLTNRVPYCWYRLLYSDNIGNGFSVTGDWEQVGAEGGAWTTNVTVSSEIEGVWKAEAREGVVPKSE
ncbi:MAG: C10 family peptidase [Kiritimatiellae bacterium]|nr:C10 family peptidase [Kiritimatiellia bacterium]